MANLIVYNASAGSGKTYTLALEYIALCLAEKNPSYFRHILAITFTNKAAHELKERILGFLQMLGEEKAPLSSSSNQLLVQLDEKLDLSVEEIIHRSAAVHRMMLYRYADLHISTIDSFILGVLRSFSKELGLPCDFDVELDHNKIIDLLIQNVLSEIGKDSFITEQLIAWSSRKLLEGSTWNPKGNMKQALEALMKEESLPYRTRLLEKGEENLETVLKEFDKERKELLKDIRSIQEEVRSRIESSGISLADFNRGKGGFISFSYKDYGVSDPPTEKHLDIARDGNLLSAVGKKAGLEDLAESIRPLLSESINQVREKAVRVSEIDRLTKNRMSLILALKLEELVQSLEHEEGMSILSDNNAKVERLIDSNPAPFIYERIGERFKHYLIDEFQDTSVLQWRNMLPLLEEGLATAKRSFLVGDAKQSIYRWRGGEVDQLVELPSIPAQKKSGRILELERMLDQNFDQSRSLVKNYRSARSIIQFNNDLFPILSEELSERYQQAYSDVKQEHIKSSEGFVRMHRVQDKVKLEEILPNVLLQVKECESLGYKGSDICILTRRNADARIIAKCLEDSGRNISSPDALLLKSNANVQLLMCFAEYLSGSESRRPVLYIISHLLKNEGKNDDISGWHSVLESKGIDATLSELLGILSFEWHKDVLIDIGPYSAMIRLIEILNMDLMDPYLQELLNQVAGFGSRKENSFTGLVEYWNDKSDSISVKAGVNPNSIQIMTIHKSKGLQFPVVILPLVDWKSGRNGKTKEWIETKETGLDVSLIDLNNKLEKSPYTELIRKEKDKSALIK